MASQIYIEDFFKNIVNDIVTKVSGTISSVTENTLTVNKTDGLQNGMYVNLNGYKENFQISNVTHNSFKVTSTKNISATSYSLCLNFLHGNKKEIAQILTEKNANSDYKYKKYPCIILYDGIVENIGNFEPACKQFENIFFIIVTDTKPEYSTEQRKELRFKTVLQPIHDLFFNELITCKYSYKLIKPEQRTFTYNKENVYFWGTEGKEQNILNSFADAIEIKNLTLKFYKQ